MKRLFLFLSVVLVLAALTLAAAWLWFTKPLVPAAGRSGQPPMELVVPGGSSARAIGFLLEDAGLPITSQGFALVTRVLGLQGRLKAGVYQLAPGDSLQDVIRKLSRGEALQDAITLIEGWTFAQVLRAVQSHQGLQGTLPADPEEAGRLLAQLAGLPTDSVEGYIFPDTYLFVRGSRDREVLLRAIRLQRRVLAEAWEARNARVAVQTPEEALILASMVEKETQHEPDRELVSAVFHNRLSIGMPLQSDPTTIYGLGPAFDGNLRRQDLRHESVFNTYRVRGLPPTPIANPGRAALVAALNPAPSKALYFVAKGNGQSHFSLTLNEHNQAVNYYQRGRGSPP